MLRGCRSVWSSALSGSFESIGRLVQPAACGLGAPMLWMQTGPCFSLLTPQVPIGERECPSAGVGVAGWVCLHLNMQRRGRYIRYLRHEICSEGILHTSACNIPAPLLMPCVFMRLLNRQRYVLLQTFSLSILVRGRSGAGDRGPGTALTQRN